MASFRFTSDEPAARQVRQAAAYAKTQVWKPAPKQVTIVKRLQTVAEVNVIKGAVIKTSSPYRPVPKEFLAPNARTVVLASTAVNISGSWAPSIDDEALRYIAGIDNVTLYFNGEHESRRIVKRRVDGFTDVLPPGKLPITGLPAGAPGAPGPIYYLYPFWIPGTCYIGWVPGEVGTPRFAHLTQTLEAIHQQNYRGREALSDGALSFQLQTVAIVVTPPPVTPPPVNGGLLTISMQVTYPGNGTNTALVFDVHANASDATYGIAGWFVYVDDVARWSTPGPTNSIDAPISVSPGGHKITVRVWNNHGDFTHLDMSINASGPAPPPPPPPSPPISPYSPPTQPRCVMLGTEIIPIGEAAWWTEEIPEATWVRLVTSSGRELNATSTHPVMTGRAGWTEMRDVRKGDKVMTIIGEEIVMDIRQFTRPGFKVCVHMDAGHTFWANGFLSHNKIFST